MNLRMITEKYKNLSIQKRSTLWYAFCNILQKGISFIIIPIYTFTLTEEEYGRYSLFLSWRDILMIIVTMNLYAGVFTKLMVDYEDERDECTSSIQTLGILLAIGYAIVLLGAKNFWSHIFKLESIILVLLLAYFAFYPSFSYWVCRQCVEYKYVKMVVATLSSAFAIPILSLILLFCTDLREKAVMLGYLIVQISIGVVFFIYNLYRGRVLYRREYWVYALRYNIPLIPHYLSQIVLTQADRVMIDRFCGEAKAGVYALAAQVSHMIGIITSAIHTAFTPWVYTKLRNKEYDKLGDPIKKVCILVGGITFAFAMVAPEALYVLGSGSEAYINAVSVVPVLMLGMVLVFVYGFFSDIEFYYGATHYVMMASVIGAVINIILNSICIPRYGYEVAAYTTLVCYVLFVAMHFGFMIRVMNKQGLDYRMVFKWKNMTILFGAGLLTLILCLFVYKVQIVRYLMVGISFVVGMLNRKRIERILFRANEQEN